MIRPIGNPARAGILLARVANPLGPTPSRSPLPPDPWPPPPVIFLGHAVAALLDLIVLCLIGAGVLLMLSFALSEFPGARRSRYDFVGLGIFALLLLCTAADIAFAASPGKSILSIVIRDASGAPAPWRRLALRWAIKYSAALLLFGRALFYQVARQLALPRTSIDALDDWWLSGIYICAWVVAVGSLAALHPTRRTLHDWIAGTAAFDAESVARPARPFERGFEVAPAAVLPLLRRPDGSSAAASTVTSADATSDHPA